MAYFCTLAEQKYCLCAEKHLQVHSNIIKRYGDREIERETYEKGSDVVYDRVREKECRREKE